MRDLSLADRESEAEPQLIHDLSVWGVPAVLSDHREGAGLRTDAGLREDAGNPAGDTLLARGAPVPVDSPLRDRRPGVEDNVLNTAGPGRDGRRDGRVTARAGGEHQVPPLRDPLRQRADVALPRALDWRLRTLGPSPVVLEEQDAELLVGVPLFGEGFFGLPEACRQLLQLAHKLSDRLLELGILRFEEEYALSSGGMKDRLVPEVVKALPDVPLGERDAAGHWVVVWMFNGSIANFPVGELLPYNALIFSVACAILITGHMLHSRIHFIASLVLGLFVLTAPAYARLVIDGYGNVNATAGQVLSSGSGSDGSGGSSGSSGGDESDDDSDDDNNSSSGSGSRDSSNSGSSSKTKTETRNPDGTRTKTEVRKDGETRTEVRLPDGTKIKTRAEEGRTRTDVYQGAVRVRFERVGDRFRIKIENAAGEEVELAESETEDADEENETELTGTLVKVGDVFQLTNNGVTYTLVPASGLVLDALVGQFVEVEGIPTTVSPTTLTITKAKLEDTDETEDEVVIEERADRNAIHIRALQHKAIVERLNVQALTDLPISVDLNTNILTVTTPAGDKQVTVLPDQAVQNMLAANVIDRLGGESLVEEVRQGNVQTIGQVIELGVRNSVPVYQVQGIKEHRFLGFFSVTTEITVSVSAETGEIVDIDQSFGDRVIDFFSTAV